ncbi:MAG: DUF490 domain-containing protein [Saprospiraceae bacterium]|nr:MAG: DUF490 domain-containing protein [Saprospiraceae bacterium]
MKVENNDKEEIPAKKSRWKQLFLWGKRLVVGVLGLLLFLVLVVQIPMVQNWMVKKVTNSLSETLQTRVNIDYLYFSFFDKLVLDGVYFEDVYQDTLLYSQSLKADFNLNPIVLLREGLVIQDLSLINARIKLRQDEGDPYSNIDLALSRLFPPDSITIQTEKRPFRLNLETLRLQNILFYQKNEVKGKELSFFLPQGEVYFNEMDLPAQLIDAGAVYLQGLNILVNNFPEKPLADLIVPTVTPPDSNEIIFQDSIGFRLFIRKFTLEEGRFGLHNYRKAPVKLTAPDILDFKHLDVFDIKIDIDSFAYIQDEYSGKVNLISCKESSGFVLNELSSKDTRVSSTGVQINDLKIITPYSEVGDTLSFKFKQYSDFEYFEDEVRMDARINGASIALSDIMAFAPGLEQNVFFRKNKNTVLNVDGRIRGQINNLRGSDLNIQLADGSILLGNFNSRNFAVKNEEILNLELERLVTNMTTLRELIPNFNPPSNFDRLGKLEFKGRFDGFFADFVAYGLLKSRIGQAELDMRMNVKNGLSKANYSGKLKLQDFNLATWSDNPDFGLVNFQSEVKNGSGLTAETANAELSANIGSFMFKGYNYKNANLTGTLNKNLFDGNFQIKDENIDFSFLGEIDFTNRIPFFDFQANVNKLALKSLNLSKEDIRLAGVVDLKLRNQKLSDLEGRAYVTNFSIGKDETTYQIDSILVIAGKDDTGTKNFEVSSDVMHAKITGEFAIDQIPGVFTQYFTQNYPGFSSRLKIKPPKSPIDTSYFTYDVLIHDTKGLNWLVDEKLGRLEGIMLRGGYDGRSDSLKLELNMPYLSYDNVDLEEVFLTYDGVKNEGDLDMIVGSTSVNQKELLPTVTFLSILEGDTINFGLNYATTSSSLLDNLNLNGFFYLPDSNYFEIRFKQSDLVLLESPWTIDENNYITFGKQYVDTRNFTLINKDRKILLEKLDTTGLKLSMLNFDFKFIDDYWDYDELDFNGKFNVHAEIGDVFKMKDIRATVTADTFRINNDDFGVLRLDAEAPDLKSQVQAYLSITKDTMQLLAEGTYNLTSPNESKKTPPQLKAKYFDFAVDIAAYPVRIGEYWIGDIANNIVGQFNSSLHFYGFPDQPNTEGFISITDGGVTVDYLNTRYTFDRGFIRVDNFLFDATGTTLYDKFNNRAVLYGGISHNHLRDLGLSARLRTSRLLALDTHKGDNDIFYGQALGSGEVHFTGSFKQTDIYVNATLEDSTHIVVPISNQREASILNVDFVDKHGKKEQKNLISQEELKGLSLEMDLTVTETALMELIFDEQAGDIISGKGRGNIRIVVPRGEDFRMYGEYIISEGNYLFTLYNVVNKDFRIEQGGTINWSGDPFGAKINIEAEYKDLKASMATFIQEYLASDDGSLASLASQATAVDLTLKLTGDLLKPNINFDLDFPNLTGQIETYAQNKLRTLKQDQSELNRQVFGLIVVGQFLPSDLSFTGSDVLANTVSEFLSNQLSLLITELFSEVIGDSELASDFNFNIAYTQYQQLNLDQGINSGGNDLEVSIRQNLFDDRLSIKVGGNVDFGNNLRATPETSGTFVGNDLVLEYVLNKNRTLKLRIYQRLEPDIGGGRRLQLGSGISYRKEFDSFKEFFNSLKGSAKRVKN